VENKIETPFVEHIFKWNNNNHRKPEEALDVLVVDIGGYYDIAYYLGDMWESSSGGYKDSEIIAWAGIPEYKNK